MITNLFSLKPISVFLSLYLLFNITSCKKPASSEPEPMLPEPIEEVEKEDSVIKTSLPHIFIRIEDNREVNEKDIYLNAEIEIEGQDAYENLAATATRIRGRGNDSWNKPKKPYRFNLTSKTSLLGLAAAKNWVLLANYQDYSLMTNAVAMKAAQLLGMPYTNTIIPVDLTINGVYRGNYTLTQHIEISKDRIDLGDDGFVLELDSYFDEDYKFRSEYFNLPVMLKDGEVNSPQDFQLIQNDFQSLEDLIADNTFPNNNYGQHFDKVQLVNYLIVYNLACNKELNHPKSVFLHKRKGGKYTMGPVWDFDWAFGFFETSGKYFQSANDPVLSDGIGSIFFNKFLKDPEIISLYRQQWALFKSQHLETLLNYIDEYANKIAVPKQKDFSLWQVGPTDYQQVTNDFKAYIEKRTLYMDTYINSLR